MSVQQPGSSSIDAADYWWFAARGELLESGLGRWLGTPQRVLDVGSADGPSAAWMQPDAQRQHQRVAIDTDPRGLAAGRDVCASALQLPFPDSTFDVVGAFDVIEHLDPESTGVTELARVLRPGGRLLVSVPAYQWAWSDHDVRAGHYRRYTRPRIERALTASGLTIERSTHAFGLVFPMFAAQRLVSRLRPARPAERLSSVAAERLPSVAAERLPSVAPERLPSVSPAQDRILRGLCRVESRWLRHHDLPFGSSVLVAAAKQI